MTRAALGGLTEVVSGALVKQTSCAVITDIELAKRLAEPIEETVVAELPQGDGSVQRTTTRRMTRWQRYRSRTTTEAVRVNVTYEQARTHLEESLVHSLVGILH